MTDTVLIGDSAYPPATYPTSFNGKPLSGWMVYIGGNTPHPWTDAEIEHLKSQPWCRYIVPVFTRSNPTASGVSATADADEAIAWSRAHGQTPGTKILWDGETAVASAYYTAVDQRLQSQAGLHEILYGSKATVVKNARPSGGYDEAAWTQTDYAPADEANQFGSWTAYDLGEFKVDELWDLRPTATPPAPASPEDDDMAPAVDGIATLSWSEGTRHIVQVACNLYSGSNQPVLNVVLLLEGGPVELAGGGSGNPPWKPDYTAEGKVFRFPDNFKDKAYGIELSPSEGSKPARYAASVS
jgi:hypothetical protein